MLTRRTLAVLFLSGILALVASWVTNACILKQKSRPGWTTRSKRLHTVVPSRRASGQTPYLAAYARAGNYTLVTFDQGFRQFDGQSCTVLTPAA